MLSQDGGARWLTRSPLLENIQIIPVGRQETEGSSRALCCRRERCHTQPRAQSTWHSEHLRRIRSTLIRLQSGCSAVGASFWIHPTRVHSNRLCFSCSVRVRSYSFQLRYHNDYAFLTGRSSDIKFVVPRSEGGSLRIFRTPATAGVDPAPTLQASCAHHIPRR
jgi:hypothetical protein